MGSSCAAGFDRYWTELRQAVAAAVARALRGVTRTREQRQVWSSRHRPWPLQLRGHCGG
jgi:hypothetical protein